MDKNSCEIRWQEGSWFLQVVVGRFSTIRFSCGGRPRLGYLRRPVREKSLSKLCKTEALVLNLDLVSSPTISDGPKVDVGLLAEGKGDVYRPLCMIVGEGLDVKFPKNQPKDAKTVNLEVCSGEGTSGLPMDGHEKEIAPLPRKLETRKGHKVLVAKRRPCPLSCPALLRSFEIWNGAEGGAFRKGGGVVVSLPFCLYSAATRILCIKMVEISGLEARTLSVDCRKRMIRLETLILNRFVTLVIPSIAGYYLFYFFPSFQVDDTEVISFLLSTEIIPLCLRTMEMGSELSKTVSAQIL
ncbi:hypothetical protein CK203_041394 [Vitis vinifera]|uniref:Uncharacterized protein n=1 Tax=Vitis vinifera TaxID=29760 RepID=A0A438H5Y6_VITVI|nr:hypothetical protein CK203_041394 [Vitis vinifera]